MTSIGRNNKVSQLLSIEYPVVQAPMFGVGTPQMVAAAARANVLGSLPLGDLPAETCIQLIQSTKQLTNKPFAANIFVHSIPVLSDQLRVQYTKTKLFLEELAKQHQLDVTLPEIDAITVNDYQEQVDVLIAEKCPIVSFTFGNLDAVSIDKFKENGTVLIGTCTSVEEALLLEQTGIDLICVQGIEAGGHRGSFITGDAIPQIGGLSLLASVSDCVTTPVIYAGGLYDAKTVLAAKMLGAEGFQIGSLLLGSAESALQEFEKHRLRTATENEIVLTNSFSGRYARGIKNTFTDTLENTPYVLPYPYQNKLTGELRKAAKLAENSEFVSIWTGQSLHRFSAASTTEIIRQLITETEQYNQ